MAQGGRNRTSLALVTRRPVPQTPALEQFLGAYLHQDWRTEADDVWGVVDLFVREEPRLAAELPAEIAALLAGSPSERDLRKLVIDDLGGYHVADAEGGSYREWLQRIADLVRTITAA
jgi:hypothetical protein